MTNVRWISIEAAADIIGVSGERVRQYAKQGRLHARKLEGTRVWLIDRKAAAMMADGAGRYRTGRPKAGEWRVQGDEATGGSGRNGD